MAHPAETEESMPADNPREAVPPRVADASSRSVPRTPSTASALSTLSRTPSSSTLSETGEELELKTLKRSPSGLQLVDRDDALRLTGTWSWDLSKVRGHRFDTSPWRAALTCLDPSANEFWNVLTEILPVLHFSWVTLELLAGLALGRGSFASSPRPMAFAVLFTCSGTIAQHAASLVSHVGRSVSPRLSHSIWFIDFAGVLSRLFNPRPSPSR